MHRRAVLAQNQLRNFVAPKASKAIQAKPGNLWDFVPPSKLQTETDQLYPTVTKPLNPRIGEGWSSETHTSSHKHFAIHQSCPIWMAHYFVGKQPRRPPYDMVGGQTSADLSLVALAFSPPTWWGSCCPSGQQPPGKVHSLSYAVLRFLVLLHVVTICYNLVICFSGFLDLGRRRQSFSKCPGLFAAHGCIPCRVKEFNKVLLRKTLIEIHHWIYSKPWGELPVPYAACPKNRFPFGSCPRSPSTSETFQKQLGQEASSSPWRSPIRRTWCRPFGAGKWETWHPLWSLQTLSLCSTLNAVFWAPNYT